LTHDFLPLYIGVILRSYIVSRGSSRKNVFGSPSIMWRSFPTWSRLGE
jgi:hypothetical protein